MSEPSEQPGLWDDVPDDELPSALVPLFNEFDQAVNEDPETLIRILEKMMRYRRQYLTKGKQFQSP